jgi:hypothetical protein
MPNTYSSTGFACIDGIYTNTRAGGYPGGNDGQLFMCMAAGDYNAIRGYDSAAGTSTIHWFGTTWANGTLGNSAGTVNHDGHCGVTLGPWNGPILIVNKAGCSVGINTGNTAPSTHNGRGLVINGRGTDTRGIIELWDGGASGGKSLIQQVGGDTYLGQLAKGTGNGDVYVLTGGSGASATISMTIKCNGNVGIGVTPSNLFQTKDVGITNTNSYFGTGQIRIGGGSDHTTNTVLSVAPGVVAFDAPGVGGGRFTINSSGNVGINKSSPAHKLNVCNTSNSEWLVAFDNTDGTESVSTYFSHGAGYGIAIDSSENNANYIFKAMSGSGGGAGKGSVPVIFAQHNGLVGIGTASPQSALHVAGVLASNPSGTGVHMGIDAGGYAGIQLTGGISTGAYIDFSCTGTDAPGRIIYYHASNSMDFTVYAASRMTIVCNGNIGVATLCPSYRLHVNGTFYAAGSSADYKQDVSQYNTDSCMFMKLNPVTYQYKDEYCHLGKELKSGTQIGLIAEDVAKVYPELAILVNEEDEKVVRNVDYEKLSIILLSELQKLRAEVDELKSK